MEKMFTSAILLLNFGVYVVFSGGVAFLLGAPPVGLSRAWFVDRLGGGWIYRGSARALHLALVSEVYFSDVEEGYNRPHILVNH